MIKFGRRTEANDKGWGHISGVNEERDGRFFVTAHPWESQAGRVKRRQELERGAPSES